MAESTEVVVRSFTQVIDVSLQIQGLVKVDAQCGHCIREMYNRACDIDGCNVWGAFAEYQTKHWPCFATASAKLRTHIAAAAAVRYTGPDCVPANMTSYRHTFSDGQLTKTVKLN